MAQSHAKSMTNNLPLLSVLAFVQILKLLNNAKSFGVKQSTNMSVAEEF